MGEKRLKLFTHNKFHASSLMLAVIAVVLFAFSAKAQNPGDVFMVDSICYRISADNDKTVEIIANPDSKAIYGNVVIPESVEFNGISYSVTEIGRRAFFGTEYMLTVSIPSSVKIIKDEAFATCEMLYDVKFAEGLVEIGDRAFDSDYKIREINFPQSLRIIGEQVFDYCDDLAKINFPENIEKIVSIGSCRWFDNLPMGEYYAGKVLLAYKFDKNAQNDRVFLKLKEGTTCVSAGVCRDFSELDSVAFPKSIKYICDEAFFVCPNLTKVIFEGTDNLIYLGEDAFASSSWVTRQEYGDLYIGNIYYSYRYDSANPMPEKTTINIKDGTVAIAAGAIMQNDNLVGINIPNSVKYIYDNALRNNENIKTIKLPDSITCIPYGLFAGNFGLTSVNIPAGVKEINSFSFASASLKSIDIPASCTYIHGDAFAMSSVLEAYNVADDNPCYASVDGVLFSKDKKTLIKYPAHKPVDYIVPEGTEQIAEFAFSESDITGVTLPASLVSLGKSAFKDCLTLTSVKFDKNSKIREISDYAFDDCELLSSVVFPDSLKSIGSLAFAGCPQLMEISIPEKLESVGSRAFRRSGWENSQPDGVMYFGKFAYDLKGNTTNEVTIKEGTTHMVRDFGWFNGTIKTLNLPASLQVMDNPFLVCDKLTTVNGGENALLMGRDSFGDTPWLDNKLNGDQVFWNNNMIILDYVFTENFDLNFKEGTRSVILNISKWEDESHPELVKSIKFPVSIEYIDNNRGEMFSNVETVTVEAPVPPVMNGNFDIDVYLNAKLYVPPYGVEAYKTTLPWCLFSNIMADPSGVECIQTPENDNIRVFADGDNIIVEGAAEGASVEVFNLNGQMIYSGVENVVNVAAKGIYVVRVESKNYKVAM